LIVLFVNFSIFKSLNFESSKLCTFALRNLEKKKCA
jgi:hypothetical protein